MNAFTRTAAGPALAAVLSACGGPADPVVFTGSTMGTTYSVKLTGFAVQADDLQAQVEAILAEINQTMSTWDPESELSRFNRRQSMEPVAISPELARVLDQSLAVSRASDGAFDITVGPLVNLWGFGPDMGQNQIPPKEQIRQAGQRVGYKMLHLEGNSLVKTHPDLYVDLSAIAKGYGVDRVAEHLESLGVEDYLVEIGGELRGRGHNARGTPWTIAVERPDPTTRAVKRLIQITDHGVATSGDYRNFFELDGVRYSHVIDPTSGWPVRHRLASVSVVAEDCARADAWATALLVLGPERGLAVARREGLAAFFIVIGEDGFQELTTPPFQSLLVE
ncbi:MAG: FAD:protein FMN transferase [Candidatus Competibacteraceae bacterium]|nr:FAD:protein FMN transferase [Candidatus Competibacteraceae bacterium]